MENNQINIVTKCECNIPNGGYCERHKVNKSKKGVELCRTRPDYFDVWERGVGPGQNVDKIQYPTTTGLAKNFGQAMVKYAQSGFKHVTTEQYKARLKVCQGDEENLPCEHYDNGRCKHKNCGCFLNKKAWLESEDCPENKWPKLNNEDINDKTSST